MLYYRVTRYTDMDGKNNGLTDIRLRPSKIMLVIASYIVLDLCAYATMQRLL